MSLGFRNNHWSITNNASKILNLQKINMRFQQDKQRKMVLPCQFFAVAFAYLISATMNIP
jgi:hypothetical protein